MNYISLDRSSYTKCILLDNKCSQCEYFQVPLKESKTHVTVQGYIANVECQLTYRNDSPDSVQTSYVFPLDDMSAVYKFEADINGKHIIAECQEKEQVCD